jgi:hypothetical protein
VLEEVERERPDLVVFCGDDVELRRTDYDVEAAIASMLVTDDPRVELIAETMRTPPAQDEVIEDAERRVFAG